MPLIVLFIIHIFGLFISLVAGVNAIIHAIFLLCEKCFIAVVLQMSILLSAWDHYKVLAISANNASRGGDNVGSWGVSCCNNLSSCLFITRSNPNLCFINCLFLIVFEHRVACRSCLSVSFLPVHQICKML